MLTKSRVVQLLFMLIVLLVLFFWRTFSPPQTITQEGVEIKGSEAVALVSLLRCDYQTPCEFISEQGEFLLNIKNLPIKAEQWIDFELSTPNENIQVSAALIVGKSMFMGEIPVSFSQSAQQLFSAKAIVAACMHDEMIWTLQITVNNGDLQEALAFDFAVRH